MVSRPTPHAPERAVDRLLTRNDRSETASPLRSTSVTNGRTRFFGEESLIVIGSQLVSGFLRVTGRLIIDGLGILTVQNLIELFGSMRVRAGGDITLDGGKIYVGGMVIDPSDSGGSVTFPGGAKVTANDGAAGVKVDSGAGWTAYVAQNGIRLAGGVGQASYTMTPDTIAVGADVVRIGADELRLSAPTATAEQVTEVLARTSTGEARWIPL